MKGGKLLSRAGIWLLRISAGALILASAAVLAARSDTAARFAAGLLAGRLEGMTGRKARVGAVSLSVLPPGARLHDLAVAGADGSFEAPLVLVREASAYLSIEDLARGRIVVDEVEADGVDVRYGPEPARRSEPRRAPEAGAGRPITLRRINLRRGTLSYLGSHAPFSLEAKEIEVSAASASCAAALCVEGTARAGAFRAAYDDHLVQGDALSAIFHFEEKLLDVSRFEVRGAGVRGGGLTRFRMGEDGAARVTTALSTSGPAAAAILGGLPVSAATLDLTATIALKEGRVEAEGKGVLTDVEYPGLAFASRAEGSFSFASGRLTTRVTAGGLSPTVAGLRAASTGTLSALIAREAGGACEAKLKVTPIVYRDLLAGVDRRLPVADVKAGAEGSVTWQSGDPSSLNGSLDVTLEPFGPGDRIGGRDLPSGRPAVALSAALRVEPGHESIRIRDGRFSIPGLEARIEGVYLRGRGGFDLDLSLSRASLAETLAALRMMPAAAAAAGRQHLEGSGAGTVHLTSGARGLEASGSLDGSALTLRPRDGTIGPFSGRAVWRYRGGRLNVDEASFTGPGWSAAGGLVLDTSRDEPLRSGRLTLRDVPADPLWTGLGLSSVAGGTLSGRAGFDLESAHPPADPDDEAGISLSLAGARFEEIPVDEAHLDAETIGPKALVRSLRVAAGAGMIEGAGTYTPDTGEGSLDIRSRDLSVGALAAALSSTETGTSGLLSIEGRALLARTGTRFTGTADVRDLVLRGLPVGGMTGRIETDADGTLARIEAPDLRTTGLLRLPAERSGTLEIDLVLAGLVLEKVRPLFPPGTLSGLAGESAGRIWGTIPLASPGDADLTARITSLSIETTGITLRAEKDSELTLRDGQVRLGSTRITGPETDVTISGVYDLRSSSAGSGNLSGHFDAALVRVFLPDLEAHGPIEVQLHANTSGDGLVYGGSLRTESGWLNFPGTPYPLENIRMTALVAPDGSLRIDGIDFNFAGGEVTGDGTGQLHGIELLRARLQLHGNNLRMVPMPDFTVLFDASMTILREGGETRMTGRMDVVRAIYTREFELEASPALGHVRAAPGESSMATTASPSLDISIAAPSDVLVRNNAALLEGSARLHVSGTLTRPEITGRISVFDGGRFRFREVTYRTEGGGIDFDSPDVVDPLLDLTARTQVQAYEITLHVLGRYSSPRFELTSEPALPVRDIVSLLVTGRTYAETYGQESGVALAAEENVGQYLTAPLTETISSTVGRILNLTSVQIEPQFFNGRADPTARITLTKRISPDLLFVYSDSLGSNQEQIYQFQYDLTRAWQLLGTRNADSTASGDVRFRHRWGRTAPPPTPPAAGTAGAASAAPASGPYLMKGGAEIKRIEIAGFPDEKGKLRKSLGLKTGKRSTRADVLEARERVRAWLVRHSYPLAVVRVTAQAPETRQGDGGGSIELRYEIDAGPHVDTEIRGVRRAKSLNNAVREALDRTIGSEELARAGSEAIRDQLGQKGFASASVRDATERRGDGIRITYDVDRGPKVSVRSISFDGAPSVPAEDLKKAMATTENRWNNSGRLRTPALKSDIEAVRAVYLSHGYLDARVADPVITLTPDRRRADVVIRVEEGEVWRAGEVVIEGPTTYPEESLREATLLARGSVVSPLALDAALERLRDTLDSNGYSEVRVKSRVEGPPAAARVVFKVEEGPRLMLASISVKGNSRTASRVILRELALRPGDPISRGGIIESQRRLYALGIFRAVDLRAVPDDRTEGQAKLVVTVTEGEPLLTAFGLGYNTEASFQEFAQVGHNNIFGTGRAASLFLSHSALQRRAQLNISDRRLFGIPFEGLITAFWEKDERESFDERRRGGAVQLKHQPNRRITLLGRYSLEDVSLFNVDPSLDPNTDIAEQDVTLANVAGSVARDARDDILNPTRGTFSTADARLYLAAVGSEQQFSRLYTSWAWFHTVAPRSVFGTSFRLGYEKPLGSTTAVPLAERFFAGGDTTLRGFGIDQAGPVGPSRDHPRKPKPVGGQFSLILNAELRFPILGALKGVVFYDTGNVFLTSGDFRLKGTAVTRLGGTTAVQDGFRHTLGAGIRFDSPLGPIRVEYGRKLDPKIGRSCLDPACTLFLNRDESRYELFISIGQAF